MGGFRKPMVIEGMNSYPFPSESLKDEFSGVVDNYTYIRIGQNRPEDQGQNYRQIHVKVFVNIYDRWLTERHHGMTFEPPIIELI